MFETSYKGYTIREVYGDSGHGSPHIEVCKNGDFVMSCDSIDESMQEIDEM